MSQIPLSKGMWDLGKEKIALDPDILSFLLDALDGARLVIGQELLKRNVKPPRLDNTEIWFWYHSVMEKGYESFKYQTSKQTENIIEDGSEYGLFYNYIMVYAITKELSKKLSVRTPSLEELIDRSNGNWWGPEPGQIGYGATSGVSFRATRDQGEDLFNDHGDPGDHEPDWDDHGLDWGEP
jgi:hypothetical protein